MAKRRKTGSKRGFSTRTRSALKAPVRRRVTNQPLYAKQRSLDLGWGEAQVPLFSSAGLASGKTRGTRPVQKQKKRVRPPIQSSVSFKQRRSLCETRSVRREAIFATGYGGKTGPQRPHQPKSKVRC